jgi:hypothetical protein
MATTIEPHSDPDPQPIRSDLGASILGPRNVPLERENPDQLASPHTDSGTIPNLKFSFATASEKPTRDHTGQRHGYGDFLLERQQRRLSECGDQVRERHQVVRQ